jgi:hypothetical protein
MTRAIYIPLLVFTFISACRSSPGDAENVTVNNSDQNKPASLYVDPSNEVRSQSVQHINEISFTEVIAYSFNIGLQGELRDIVHDHGVNPTAKLPGKKLDSEQVKELFSIMNDTGTFGGGKAACFYPRMGIVFYYKGMITGQLNICFECNSMGQNMRLPGMEHYNNEEKFYRTGFSREGRKKLKRLCSSLGLEQCNDHSELFDK